MNAGSAEVGATCGLTAPGNATALLGVMDKGLWRVGAEGNDGWSYSPLPGRSVNRSAVAHLRSIDNAADDPAFVVGLFPQDGSHGWSEDWGRTFTALAPPPGQPSGVPGGDCAGSTRRNNTHPHGQIGRATSQERV